MSALLSLFSLQGLYAEEGEKVVVIKPACLAETTTPNRAIFHNFAKKSK